VVTSAGLTAAATIPQSFLAPSVHSGVTEAAPAEIFPALRTLLLPLPVLWLDPEVTRTTFVLSLAIPGGIHFVANLLEPKVVGDSLGLHPITIMMALVFWTMLWGPVGALLAAPMTAVIAILLERFDGSRPIALLLAGQFGEMRKAM